MEGKMKLEEIKEKRQLLTRKYKENRKKNSEDQFRLTIYKVLSSNCNIQATLTLKRPKVFPKWEGDPWTLQFT